MSCSPPYKPTLRDFLPAVVVGWLSCFYVSSLESSPPAETQAEQFYEDRVELIVERRCYRCHNPEARKGNLDLTTPAGLITGNDSGAIVVAGDRTSSLIYEAIHSGEMPPEGEPLSEADIELIGGWIASGAKFRVSPDEIKTAPHQHNVLPILLLRCATCHGAELKRGGLDLRTLESINEGGDSGPALVRGNAAASRMIQRIEQQLCPPKAQLLKYFVKRPSSTEVELLRNWIASGAREGNVQPDVASSEPDRVVTDEDRQHWAFQALPNSVNVPRFDRLELPQPIDAFIYAQLQGNGLEFSPQAERAVLIRRVHFDLTGLPPTLEEWSRWNSSSDHDWYPQMIDELLMSPKYGERWGRYWLDVAGYADSEGGVSEDVVREIAWKYRDYVIRSHNDDKPWDRFLLEQLAGDELADYSQPEYVTEAIVDNLTATGFLRMGVDQTGSRTMNFVPERIGLIADALNVVSSGVMGLTMECARCHSHKYDPIPQRDYYRLKAIFQGAFDEHDWMSWKTRSIEVASSEMLSRQNSINPSLEKEIKKLEAVRKQAIKTRQNPYYESNWPKISEEEQKEILAAMKESPDRRTLRQDELIMRYETEIRPVESVLVTSHPELGTELETIDQRLATLRESLLPPLAIRALWDRGRPSPTYMLIRGEHDRPGRLVGPGVPSVLTDGQTPLEIEPPWPNALSTGRRLAFARWLTEADHPLTARVLVNRVWKHHFGQGIVKSLDNFGILGTPPTHPELLDWLARDFIQGGWSLKSLHRKILLSRTYQQSSSKTPERDRIDPENRWLSRMTMQRLDAEAMRDSILAIAGRLDDKMFGPPAKVDVREDGLIMDQASSNGMYRRSIYLRLRRTEMPSLLATFDYPDMQPNCNQRTVSTVSPQSLMLSNNSRIYDLAEDMSRRLYDNAMTGLIKTEPSALAAGAGLIKNEPSALAAGANFATVTEQGPRLAPSAQVEAAFRLVLSRSPDRNELAESCRALAELRNGWRIAGSNHELASSKALTTFFHTLLNSAEFLYVD